MKSRRYKKFPTWLFSKIRKLIIKKIYGCLWHDSEAVFCITFSSEWQISSPILPSIRLEIIHFSSRNGFSFSSLPILGPKNWGRTKVTYHECVYVGVSNESSKSDLSQYLCQSRFWLNYCVATVWFFPPSNCNLKDVYCVFQIENPIFGLSIPRSTFWYLPSTIFRIGSGFSPISSHKNRAKMTHHECNHVGGIKWKLWA